MLKVFSSDDVYPTFGWPTQWKLLLCSSTSAFTIFYHPAWLNTHQLKQGRPWILSHTLESRRSGPKDVSGPLFFLGCEVARHSNSNQIGTTKGQTSWPENFLVAALNRVENPVFAGPRHTSVMRCRPLAAASFADWLQAFGHSYASYANGRI